MIQVIERAIQILETFSPQEPRLTLSEISSRTKLPKSTTHNILKTLAKHGYIEKVDTDHYALGKSFIPITQSVRVNAELRDRAAPTLRNLADSVEESVYLTVLDGDFALYIYAIETPSRLMARTAVGERGSLHCTGVGKAILAYLPWEKTQDIIHRRGLPTFTETTITSVDKLKLDLADTKMRGFSIDRQEHEPGTFCIGAPILDNSGQVIGACSVSGQDPHIISTRMGDLAGKLLYAALDISRQMGFIPSRPPKAISQNSLY